MQKEQTKNKATRAKTTSKTQLESTNNFQSNQMNKFLTLDIMMQKTSLAPIKN